MTPTPPRTTLRALLLVLAALSPLPADAFQITLTKLTEADSNATVQEFFFNQARCECETALLFTIEWDLDPGAFKDVTVLAGTSCLNTDVNSLKDSCEVLYQQTPLAEIRSNIRVPVTARQLMGADCTGQNQQSRYIFVYVNTPDNVDVWQESLNFPLTADTRPPRNPTVEKLRPGENQVTVSFGASSGTTTSDAGTSTQETDIKGYQVLCQKVIQGDGGSERLEPGKMPPPAPAYLAAVNLCNAPCGTAGEPALDAGAPDGGSLGDGGPVDGSVADAPSQTADLSASSAGGIDCLEARFVCSGLSAATATSITVDELENGQPYRFYVVAVDRYDNPSDPVLIGQSTPALQEDLAERYERSGGKASGEDYCFVATAAYGSLDHPQVRILRQFRDQVLLRGELGRRFVAAYYQHSPGPAAWLARHGSLRPLARAALWPLTLGASAWLHTTGWQLGLALLLALLAISGLAWRRASSSWRPVRSSTLSAGRLTIAATWWILPAALLLVGARPAHAQVVSVADQYESPRRFLAEIKLGPYAPNIDAEFDGSGPYEHIFGDGQNLMFSGELALELWQGFGTLAIGASLGYFYNRARAFLDESADGTSPSVSETRLDGETGINLLPAALLAIYRFDVLAQRWRVPLVPYVKAGLNYTLWWITKPGGDLATLGGKDAIGASYGWQVNIGCAFLLDVLEPNAAKTLDVDLGINHTYLFFELVHVQADRFGADGALQVGDTTWSGGLTFEF